VSPLKTPPAASELRRSRREEKKEEEEEENTQREPKHQVPTESLHHHHHQAEVCDLPTTLEHVTKQFLIFILLSHIVWSPVLFGIFFRHAILSIRDFDKKNERELLL